MSCMCHACVTHRRSGRPGRGQNPSSYSKSSARVDGPRYRVFCNRPSIKEVTAIRRHVVESAGNQAKSEQIALKTSRVNFIQRSLGFLSRNFWKILKDRFEELRIFGKY